jgi:hypothetical protein
MPAASRTLSKALLADCSGHDHGCRITAIGPFSVVAAEVGKPP